MKFNLKGWKKVSASAESAVMRNDAGHELKISLKSLSPKIRADIHALPVHLADGGEVKKEEPLEIEKVEEPEAQKESTSPAAQDATAATTPAAAPQPDESLTRKRELYNLQVNTKRADSPDALHQSEDPGQYMFGAKGEEPSKFDPQAWNAAETAFNQEAAAKAQQAQMAQQNALAENQARSQAGLSPIAVPAAPGMAQREPNAQGLGASTLAPAQTPGAPSVLGDDIASDEMKLTQQGVAQQKKGLKLEADAIAQQAAAEATAADHAMKAQQEILDDYQQQNKAIQGEYASVLTDVKNGHIDTGRFWANKSGIGKASTILGIIAGGFGRMAGEKENPALQMLEKDIDRDIEAQKANMNQKSNILNAISNQMGNLRSGTEMLKAIKMGIASEEMKKAALGSKDEMAKARLLQASGELDMKVAPIMAKMAAQQTVSKLMKVVNNDPSKAPLLFDAMRKIDPKQASDLQERYVPGVGFANTGKDATDIKEMKGGLDSAKGSIAELMKIANKPFKSLNMQDRANADTWAKTLVGALRLPITGPGAMNEGERKMLEDIIADPTKIFSLDSVNKARLNTLTKSLDMKFADAAKARGLNIPSKESQLSAQQQSYVKWARANPGNKKSKLILQKLGLEE